MRVYLLLESFFLQMAYGLHSQSRKLNKQGNPNMSEGGGGAG